MGVYSVKTRKNSIQHKLTAHRYFSNVIFKYGEIDLNDYDDISPKKRLHVILIELNFYVI